ncbi:MAG: helix-turn-helix domain-containing protein [Planctomycetota bacterium]
MVGYRDKRRHIVRDVGACTSRIYLEFEYRRVDCPKCQAVRQETLAWPAPSHRFTKRFEERIGKECRDMPLSRVAENHGLDVDSNVKVIRPV